MPSPSRSSSRCGLIRALADDVDLRTSDTGTTIRFHFATSQAGAPPVAPVTPSELIDLTSEESTDGTQVLRVTGDLDTCAANELRAPLLAHIDRQGDRRPVATSTSLLWAT
ncbi:hypothetical protein G7043_25145 [Lentzea sp. NEAU-D13]|uniref:Uncharacterized protein n=1 Tax=Lentzea alba TaxID=2714351 RepID=A0A7C9VYI9_9PSEU|nr:hypothetical protein [Lentzea alba]NGY62218.1 hypothetical protein [Lentzea alba]